MAKANAIYIIMCDSKAVVSVRLKDHKSGSVVPVQAIKGADPDVPFAILEKAVNEVVRQPVLGCQGSKREMMRLLSKNALAIAGQYKGI